MIISCLEKTTGWYDDTIFDYFRRFWQGGQVPNALLTDYKNCGRNKNRKNEKKWGRRFKEAKEDDVLENINITPQTKALLQRGYDEFYRNGATLEFALQCTHDAYFSIGTRAVVKNGKVVAVPVLPHISKLPTMSQFKYHCHIPRDIEKVDQRHESPGGDQHEHDPREGSLSILATRPGEHAGIDATPFRIRLVSRINAALQFKNPIVSLLVCYFSPLIMSINVTLESESFMEAAVTILNSGTDKVEYAARYGR